MKLLADMGISMSTVRSLRERGHDAVHLGEERLHRLSDAEILQKARDEGRVVLTFDLGFGDLLAAGVHESPSVVTFRLQCATPEAVTDRALEVIAQRSHELETGAIVTVEDFRYRLRRLPVERPRDGA